MSAVSPRQAAPGCHWRGRLGYPVFFRVDIGTGGKELVDDVQRADTRRNVERGHAILWWRSEEAPALRRGEAVVEAEYEAWKPACGENASVSTLRRAKLVGCLCAPQTPPSSRSRDGSRRAEYGGWLGTEDVCLLGRWAWGEETGRARRTRSRRTGDGNCHVCAAVLVKNSTSSFAVTSALSLMRRLTTAIWFLSVATCSAVNSCAKK